MENPCLTFATPTLLSGDKSNADVIAHEIAHSWTGNLVTNINMEHFWLNEGFTTFLQRKIEGRLHGELTRHLKHQIGWRSLEEKINVDLGADNPLTSLVVNLTDVNPDDAFSRVPYEKGATFLWMLEELVGGSDIFEPFLKSYIQQFSYSSINSDDFKSYFLEYFSGVPAVEKIDWETWLYSAGMPVYRPQFNDSLARESWDLAQAWRDWNPDSQDPQNLGERFRYSYIFRYYFYFLFVSLTVSCLRPRNWSSWEP